MGRVWKQDLWPEKLELDTINITIERVHRVGEKSSNKERAIVIQFSLYKYKINILRNYTGTKLKGTKYSIFEDFPQEAMQIRKEKWKEVLSIRKQGMIPYLQYRSVICEEGQTPA